MTDRDEPTLAAEFVLGLLDERSQAEAERRLLSDAAFARSVERWRAVASDRGGDDGRRPAARRR